MDIESLIMDVQLHILFFKDQVKACLNNTFGADTKKHINNTLMKLDTRVLALVFNEIGLWFP